MQHNQSPAKLQLPYMFSGIVDRVLLGLTDSVVILSVQLKYRH